MEVDDEMIGIKLANGEFYPIVGEKGDSAKRLVLTTVKDDQQTVHIDLYRGDDGDFGNPSYLGSLVIDGISERPKQVPDIELTLAVDESGELKARAADRESGASRSLTVSLTQGVSEPEFTMPDFELDTEAPPEEDRSRSASSVSPLLTLLRDEEEEEPAPQAPPAREYRSGGEAQFTQANAFRAADPGEDGKKGKLHPALLIGIIVGAILLLALLAFLVIRFLIPALSKKPEASPIPALASTEPSATPEPTLEPTPEPTPVPTPQAATAADELGKNGSKGLTIRIKWGDTLWDLATRYYGNPWLYKKIAKANKIKNPDLIIAGRSLWIPPR